MAAKSRAPRAGTRGHECFHCKQWVKAGEAHSSIMFSIRKVVESSKTKRAHILRITHRDEVEASMTDWLQEAYATSETLSGSRRSSRSPARGTRGTGRSSPSS